MKFVDLKTNTIVIANADLAKEYLKDKNYRIAMDADFKESDHPRDKDGQFTSGGGGSSSSSKVGTTSNYDKMTSSMKKIETKYKKAKSGSSQNSGELADKAYAISSKGMSPEAFEAHLEASIAYDIEGKRALSERHREISNNIFTKLGYEKKKEAPKSSNKLSKESQEKKAKLEGQLSRFKAQLSALERHPNVSATSFFGHSKVIKNEIAELEQRIKEIK